MTEYKKNEHNILLIGGGTNIRMTEFVYTGRDKGQKIYIQSGLHGGETSQWVLYKLHNFLMQNLTAGEIHIVPYANPLAWLQRTYYSTAGKFSQIDGKDYNRCFTDSTAADSNSVLCGKITELAAQCDFAVDLHTSKMSNPFAIYTKPEYESYVKILGLKYNQFSDDAAIPALHGTFNACLDRHNIPNITVECGGHDEYNPEKTQEVYEGLTRLLLFLIKGDKTAAVSDIYSFETRKKIYAPTAGLVNYLKPAGTIVTKGDIIAELHPADDIAKIQYITAAEDGVVHVLNPSHIVWQGDIVAEVIPLNNLVKL
uniref:Succinylglutamate desuccinylase/Aspartoacylase catalytic domain-containing protein n=1 Tax=uncultured Alphaproteobacteria bacterium TaxID=91750 RepID=A0A6G8F3D2_9PROT|nr:hypothetical protein PlAlph_5940 [uncultured Alphaproteobacteria bacterium]